MMYLYYNDSMIDADAAAISPLAQGFQFGLGVFETILVADGIPCFMGQHLERLSQGCERLGLQLSYSMQQFERQARVLIQENQISNGRLKIICFRDLNGSSTLMTVMPYAYREVFCEEGFKLQISGIRRNPASPVTYIKSLNYAENILAREDAVSKGCDEALLLNVNNRLCEGTVSNIFWVKNRELYTPEVGCGVLDGITRHQVLQIAADMQLKVWEGSFEPKELLNAQEVFITNSLMGIMPVCRIESNAYDIPSYVIARILFAKHQELIRAEFNASIQ